MYGVNVAKTAASHARRATSRGMQEPFCRVPAVEPVRLAAAGAGARRQQLVAGWYPISRSTRGAS
jgi:hypothetical protein